MTAIRAAACLAIVIAASVAEWRWVAQPWHCERQKAVAEIELERHSRLSGSMSQILRTREACAATHVCVEREPRDIYLRAEHAGCLRLMGRMDEAAAQYARALEIDHRPEIYLNFAQTLYSAGRREEAMLAFSRAMAFSTFIVNYDPDLPWSGEAVLDLVPYELRRDVERRAQEERKRIATLISR